jgi:glucokinase
MIVLAIDIGGTKTAAALIMRQDDGQPRILAKTQHPTDLTGPQAVVGQIASMAQQFGGEGEIGAVGVSVPAVVAVDTDRVIWAPNLPGWRDVPLREMVEDRLSLPACIEYDGHAAVLGEWWAGAARGYQNVAMIIIGTGIGGGLIIDGKLWPGRDRLAGAVGWFPLLGPDGVDHWESLASGPAIARRAQQLIEGGHASELNADTLTAKAVFEAARRGDGLSRQVVHEFAEITGQGVASVISMANPEIVVLGGSIGQQGDLLLDTVRESARRWAQPISAGDLPIISSTLGEEAGLLGAAYAVYLRG